MNFYNLFSIVIVAQSNIMAQMTHMNRRQFVTTVAGASALMVLPSAALAAAPQPAAESILAVSDEIRGLELYLQATPDKFSWWVHNELRHAWLAFDEARSREHADIIFQHTPMDGYILHTLSDWHFTNDHGPRDPQRAVAMLQDNADRYRHLVHLRAACLCRSGQAWATELQQPELARQAYAEVMALGDMKSLHAYRMIASNGSRMVDVV
jgi:hypothetical protein